MSKRTQALSLFISPPLSHIHTYTNKNTKWCYWHSADPLYKKVIYAMMKECCLHRFQDGSSMTLLTSGCCLEVPL